MIVFRDQRYQADPRRVLSLLRSAAGQAGAGPPSHELAREVLIEAGVLECALSDIVFAHADGLHPLIRECRAASVAAGHAFWHTWHGHPDRARRWWHRVELLLEALRHRQLPPAVDIRIPEGYAQYSLYPEMYLEAAKRCHAVIGDGVVVCIGLRSIGTSLSAVVAASLGELGHPVESFTVRPRGHPYTRTLCLDPELTSLMRTRPQATHLVIDEGPGISGSSIAGTVTMLSGLGIADEHICLFTSWRTSGSLLRSPEARKCWGRHRQFTSSFEEVWLDTGRLAEAFPGELRDLSAGRWRRLAYADASLYPAVQPQHERRKYLLTPGVTQGLKLLRFAGFGRRVEAKMRRAEDLADAGFAPRPETMAHGFLLRSFAAGHPVSPGAADAQLLHVVASYLAHLSLTHAREPSVSDSELREMVAVNVAEGLSNSGLDKRVLDLPAGSWIERPVALDGRMLAHEWIRTRAGYLKVDAMDHHDDHFFPGCQDIAWDLAAALIELRLDHPAAEYLVNCYRTLSGDQSIAERLPVYSIAYLAFRLGYTHTAATSLGHTPDGDRFTGDSRRYAGLLSRRLTAMSVAGSHA